MFVVAKKSLIGEDLVTCKPSNSLMHDGFKVKEKSFGRILKLHARSKPSQSMNGKLDIVLSGIMLNVNNGAYKLRNYLVKLDL
ncbi:Uncharacterized protein TCM_013630 [Theobroma cacao]|uniref:Uncharacterized protein n=1 Tax=Theobroma cacao TaxID=3641 RepID=A0A061FX71_THECC|nr:Uncharacterized protein TCM_013630 [Theobroma cacao]